MLQGLLSRRALLNAKLFNQHFKRFSTSTLNENASKQLPNEEEAQEILNKIISSHVAYKTSLIQLLDTYHYFKNINSESSLREMRDLHNQHLTQLNSLVVAHRVPPPIIPLTNFAFTLFGCVSSVQSQDSCDQLAAQLCRIVENHTDYCLFQLNQSNLSEQQIRKVIIKMRDSSYDLSEKVLSSYPEGNPCVQNISDYVFQPILRQHFGNVE